MFAMVLHKPSPPLSEAVVHNDSTGKGLGTPGRTDDLKAGIGRSHTEAFTTPLLHRGEKTIPLELIDHKGCCAIL